MKSTQGTLHRFGSGIRLSRRRFVTGLAAGGAALAWGRLLAAADGPVSVPELAGERFDLRIGYQRVNFTGVERLATTINGSLPGPILHWREGDRVRLRVTNQLAEETSLHWHGIVLPAAMDGVPGMSFHGIQPGESFDYAFDVRQNGTYWYHSHSGFQEQTGNFGALVIHPRAPDPFACVHDYVVMLSDWTDEDPANVHAKLKKLSHYYNFGERTAGDLWRDIQTRGVAQIWRERAMWNWMRMSDSDISDVSGHTYTYLMNGQPPAAGWTGLFRPGERVRLRFINAAAMTYFDVRIPGLKMRVIAADGQPVEPVTVDDFRIGVAETYDVIVEPAGDTAYALFAQAIDRSGYALGTLTPDPGLKAALPTMDPRPVLTHVDMGMSGMAMGATDAGGADMGDMDMSGNQGAAVDHSTMDHAAMGHAMPAVEANALVSRTMSSGAAGYGSSTPVRHSATEYGPQVDARAEPSGYRLDDPGVGLRDHQSLYGRRVLTYADLRHRYGTPDPREPEREIQLHLTGNMARYMWSLDGIRFADAEPLLLRLGERLRITLVNDTMMHHPIHLHGMWSDLETGDGARIPRKHTVSVPPGARISYLVTADAPGNWAYHCHLLYHMLGMMREVRVEGGA
ncbi:MAG: copper resistance system multicopper oxidase [Porticoccaceae bacterium]|nr:MAG: copper resistance system multicopper oxidase [Porticoccaceae bacterium]